MPAHQRKIKESEQQIAGEKYINEEVAKLKRGKVEKEPRTLSPFYVEFEYGAQNKGYCWT